MGGRSRIAVGLMLLAPLATALPSATAAPAGTVVNVCSQASLKGAIAKGGTVTFSLNCPDIVLTTPIAIPATLTVTVDATGHTVAIDGNHTVRVIVVNGGNLTLTALKLENGQATGANGSGGTSGTNGTQGPDGQPGASAGAGTGDPGQNGTAGTAGTAGNPGQAGVAGKLAKGGGILINSGAVTLNNDTVIGNSADGGNGGAGGSGGFGGVGGKGGDGGSGGSPASGNGGGGGKGAAGGAGGVG